jgi:endo-1,4-beta-xylanase
MSFPFSRRAALWFLALCLLVFPRPAAVHAQTGTAVLPTNTATTYSYGGANASSGSVTLVSVAGQSFTQAMQVTYSTTAPYMYNAQISWPTTAPVAANDLLVLTFWVRKLSPLNGSTIFCNAIFEQNGSPYTRSLTSSVPCDTDQWVKYAIPFKATAAYAAGGAAVRFQVANGPQTFELGGVQCENYGQLANAAGLPTAYYYPGSLPTAPWRANAAANIEAYRKGDLTVRVVDTNGYRVSGASVHVQMKKHAFKFGSAINASRVTDPGTGNNTYKQKVLNLFNTAVFENDLKWVPWENNPQQTLNGLAWCSANGITVRGHTLIWPAFARMPSDCASLAAAALNTRINNHFTDILGSTYGQCYQWDVVNEPYTNYDVQGRISGVPNVTPSTGVLGNYKMVEWFTLARSLEPNAKLYLNDYNILEAGGNDINHQNYDYALLEYLLNNNAPVDGFGMQSHFTTVTPIDKLLSIIDRFSQLPIDLAVTEFDFDTMDENLQANYTRDLMTIIFSSPKFNEFLMWGFWEGAHWRPRAAMYRQNWTEKPNGLAYRDLVFTQWWTDVTGTSNSNGEYTTRAFKGDYDIIVTRNGQTYTVPATLGTNQLVTVTVAGGASTLNASADASVRDGIYAANNYGTATSMDIKNSTTDFTRYAYIKFDISGISPTVANARLRLYGRHNGTVSPNTSAYGVTNNSWTETGITWANKPSVGALQVSKTITQTTQYYEWDVTSFVRSQKAAGATAVTLVLTMDASPSDNQITSFNSREATGNRPQLVVSTN